MHHLSLLNIISEYLVMHICYLKYMHKNDNIVQTYGALYAYIQKYKSCFVYCGGLGGGDSIIWSTDKEKCLQELFFLIV